ncbi:MAG TPA: UDP-glucose 4-epimerase GalE [Desulfobacterales bacterium]
MNILVTGGAGYIGSHCCKELHLREYTPITLDNLVYGHRENVRWGPFVEGDIGDRRLLDKTLEEYTIDAVMHFAAFAYVGESVADPRKYYRNNVQATITLLDAICDHQIEAFIFSSSCATYGLPERIPIDETHPRAPISPYGKTKYMVEEILSDYAAAYPLRFMSLRYFNAAGADPQGEIGEKHDPETHLIPLVLDVAMGKSPQIMVFGSDYDTPDGSCIRDYIHVSDLARAHVLALQKLLDGAPGDFVNLGIGRGYSVFEVIETAARVTGRELPHRVVDRRPGDPATLVASNDKARKLLGWQPEHVELADIIRTAWHWHQRR